MKIITTDKAPQAIGPYSQAIAIENFIFCSGQIGIDPTTGILRQNIEDQTHQVLQNINAVLSEAEANKNSVVKTTIFLKSMEDFSTVNNIYEEFFGNHKPARSTVAVSELPKGALIEIEVIALLS